MKPRDVASREVDPTRHDVIIAEKTGDEPMPRLHEIRPKHYRREGRPAVKPRRELWVTVIMIAVVAVIFVARALVDKPLPPRPEPAMKYQVFKQEMDTLEAIATGIIQAADFSTEEGRHALVIRLEPVLRQTDSLLIYYTAPANQKPECPRWCEPIP